MKVTVERLLVAVLLIVICFLYVSKCNSEKEIKEIIDYKDSVYTENVKGISVSYNKSLVLSSEKHLRDLLSKDDTIKKLLSSFKKVKTVSVIREVLRIDTDTIYLDSLIPIKNSVSFNKKNESYSIYGKIDSVSVIIDSLNIPNTQTIIVGDVKRGLFKPKETEIKIVNSNKLMNVKGIQSFVIKEEKKWHERKIFWFSLGFIGSFATYQYLK